ncbi:hypothetical protein CaCOL14_000762 [Colletotrichum acutatum]
MSLSPRLPRHSLPAHPWCSSSSGFCPSLSVHAKCTLVIQLWQATMIYLFCDWPG